MNGGSTKEVSIRPLFSIPQTRLWIADYGTADDPRKKVVPAIVSNHRSKAFVHLRSAFVSLSRVSDFVASVASPAKANQIKVCSKVSDLLPLFYFKRIVVAKPKSAFSRECDSR